MKKYIGIIVAVLFAFPLWGEQKSDGSVEREQQFTYYWYAARQAIDEERYSDAYALLEFCRWVKPDDGMTLGYLGVIYHGLGQDEKAMACFKKAFECDPNDQWFRYVNALWEINSPEANREAVRVMEKAYDVHRKTEGKKQKPKETKVTDEELLEHLKRAYLINEEWKKALAVQDETDRLKGYDAYSALTRFRVYAAQGKTKQALAAIDKYLETDPDNLRFLYFRLELLERTNAKPKQLYAMYDRILALDPFNLMVLNNYAYLLAINGGDLQKAERMSALTIREAPDNAMYLDTYGWIMHLKGNDQLALFYLNRAIRNAEEATRKTIEQHIKECNK